MKRRSRTRSAVVVALAATGAMANPASAEPASASVSCGSVNRGGLGNPLELARRGAGFEIPDLWWRRGRRYGTAELVGLIRRAAASVDRRYPGARLGVGDLSRGRGGAIPKHRSHQSGRDVDLIYYTTDLRGRPLAPGGFLPRFRRDGRATHASSPTWMKLPRPRRFDRRRNWALIAALVTDPSADIERIFVSLRIHRWLMAEARRSRAPADVIEAASDVLRVARGREDHGDHMHVRIRCTAEDIRQGLCRPYLAPSKPGGGKWRWGVRCPR